MVEFKQGAIAVLDVLGVKGIWARGDTGKIIREWESTVQHFKGISKQMKKDPKQRIKPSVQAFSDTIIIAYEGKNPLDLLGHMGMHITFPFCTSILNGIYLRGAISIGKFRKTESMIIGPAADEAVSWYEFADWMGIMLTPTSSFSTDKLVHEKWNPLYFKQYDIPFNDGQQRKLWALNWPAFIDEIMKDYLFDKRDPKEAILQSFSSSPSDPSSLSKYTNTLSFFDHFYEKRKLRSEQSSEKS